MVGPIQSRLTYANVMATVAVFLALGGGAYAVNGSLAGKNTVGSADIINEEVRTADVRNDSLQGGGLRAGDLAPNAVGGSELADVNLLRAHTARLHDDPGGVGAGEPLFTIGRVDLNAFCSVQGNGSLTAGISPVVDEPGAVIVTDGDGSSPDASVPLQPFDVQFVVILNSASGVSAREASFAILDETAASASGVAAVSADQGTGDCMISAHAVG